MYNSVCPRKRGSAVEDQAWVVWILTHGETAAKGTYVEHILKSALMTCRGSAKPRVCTVTSQGHQAKSCAPEMTPLTTAATVVTLEPKRWPWQCHGLCLVELDSTTTNRPTDFCHLLTSNQKTFYIDFSHSFISIFFQHPSFLLSISSHTSLKSTVLIRTVHIGLHYCWHSGPDLLGILCTWTNRSNNLSHQTFSGGISL